MVVQAHFFGFKLLRAATRRKMPQLQLLETNLLDARRVFRRFREIEPFQALMRQVNLAAADWWIKTCSVAQMIALCGVFVSIHLTLMSKVKLLKFDIGRARWIFGLFFLIVTSLGLLQDLRRMLLVQRNLNEMAAVSHAGDSSSASCTSKQQTERNAKRSEQKEAFLAFRHERESVLFIGTQFSILYTSMYSPSYCAGVHIHVLYMYFNQRRCINHTHTSHATHTTRTTHTHITRIHAHIHTYILWQCDEEWN